ncbi:MAG TPA: lipoprotein [Steroidobacteraceae bacterium]|jgi:diaminopimelate decarboxylase|nr:lipoprotein [Steroidobacteraceae bacterium]
MSGAFSRAGVGVVLAATLALAGCGQKGPLYLPEKPGAVVTAPPAPPPAAPGQPPQPSPASGAQSTAEPPPADVAAPPKKSDKDEDAQTPH